MFNFLPYKNFYKFYLSIFEGIMSPFDVVINPFTTGEDNIRDTKFKISAPLVKPLPRYRRDIK